MIWDRQTYAVAIPSAIVAIVAGVVSFGHIEGLALSVHQPIADARLLPFAVDGLIVAGTVVILGGYLLGWLGVAVGGLATIYANVMSGLPYGHLAATVAAWPAVSFIVASFLLERWIKRQVGRVAEGGQEVDPTVLDAYVDPLRFGLPGLWGMSTCLYRYFNVAKEVIYIGIAYDFATRHSAHLRDDDWAHEIDSHTIEWFDNRMDAAYAEVAAVLAEKPKHNKVKWLIEGGPILELDGNGRCDHHPADSAEDAIVTAYLHGRDCLGIPPSQRKLAERFGLHRTKVAALVGSLNGGGHHDDA